MTQANEITWIGSTGYAVTRDQLRRIKAACKIAKLPWQTIAARPSTVDEFISRMERLSGQTIK